jgi:hypothetical protein
MSTNLIATLQEILQNTTNLRVLKRLMTPEATYVSLSFDNPELKEDHALDGHSQWPSGAGRCL